MNRTTMIALAALGLAASGMLFNLRPVASAPAPTQAKDDCLTELIYTREAGHYLTMQPPLLISFGAQRVHMAAQLEAEGRQCEATLAEWRQIVRDQIKTNLALAKEAKAEDDSLKAVSKAFEPEARKLIAKGQKVCSRPGVGVLPCDKLR